ncbi:MAG: SurA N-terminal domain-containing protein, partial [Candidatus Omnitrophica bacterium]|nr:SurA N-terminal domain-containing protein [Candidatus Omnitrophota bacterium]
QPITQRDYYQRLGQTEQNYRRFFGDRFEEIARNLNLEKGVLEELIQEKILSQEARRRHLKVADSELVEAVKSDPAFRDEKGNFSQERFSRIIAQVPPDDLAKFEEETRRRLLQQKLKQQVVSEGNVTVTDQEVKDYLEKNKGTPADQEQVRKMLLWQKEEKYYRDWYDQLRQKAKVVVYLQFPERPTPLSSEKENTARETSTSSR